MRQLLTLFALFLALLIPAESVAGPFMVLHKRGSAWAGGGSETIDVDGVAANAGWGYPSELLAGWGRIRLGQGYSAFIRFPECPVPQGKTITKADLKLFVYSSTGQSGLVTLKVYFNDVDDASVPVDWAAFAALARTAAYLDTNYTAFLSKYDLLTWDVKAPLQEVIDRDGYATGNDIQVIIVTYAAAAPSDTDFFITDATYYATLELEWE
jgi:hypothetical protein